TALALRTMPVAAGVVGDDGVPARLVLPAPNMTAEGRPAAALDRAHHLELAEAHMAAVGATPSGPVIAEDVRDFQSWTGHGWRRLRRRGLVPNPGGKLIERAHHLTQHFAGDVGIARCRIKLRMSQSHLDQTDVDTFLEKMRRKAVTQCMW